VDFYSAGWGSVAEDHFGLLLLPHWVGENVLPRIALLDWYVNILMQMWCVLSLSVYFCWSSTSSSRYVGAKGV